MGGVIYDYKFNFLFYEPQLALVVAFKATVLGRQRQAGPQGSLVSHLTYLAISRPVRDCLKLWRGVGQYLKTNTYNFCFILSMLLKRLDKCPHIYILTYPKFSNSFV